MDADCLTQAGWRFETTYRQLPPVFYADVRPTPVARPQGVVFNDALAARLGLQAQALDAPTWAALLSGNTLPEGLQPLAQAYAGHQYGHFTLLGDGRAILLGEHLMPNGQRVDIQLKGAGQTPYSRRGDGRAALGPMLREYLISEAMAALGIPTTRSLAVVATGEPVYRDTPLPGAVLVRVAASHLRVGTLEYAAALEQPALLKAMADYAIARHDPGLQQADNPYQAFLRAVAERQARLLARWMQVGFVHGVMNTDNMTLSGETIDYGPCAFLDAYDPEAVFSSIDHHGRYAFARQPRIAQWNLARLAETLLPLLDPNPDQALLLAEDAALNTFSQVFQSHWLTGMRSKLGLFSPADDDAGLVEALLVWMHRTQADYTNTFRALSSDTLQPHTLGEAFVAWHQRWQVRLQQQDVPWPECARHMRACNPAVIPRNHGVEAALRAAVEDDHWAPFTQWLAVLATPFDDPADPSSFCTPAPAEAPPYRTFCGT